MQSCITVAQFTSHTNLALPRLWAESMGSLPLPNKGCITNQRTGFSTRFFSTNVIPVQREWKRRTGPTYPCLRTLSVLSQSVVHLDPLPSLVTNTAEEQIPKQEKAILRNKRKPPQQKVFTSLEKLDKCGRLRTPRAARELSLSVLYAAFVSSVHPLKVFDDRMKQRAEGFDKTCLEGYDHSPDAGENIVVEDEASLIALEQAQEAELSLEAKVLTAPPPLVYNNFATRLARSLVKETSERWLQQEAILMEILPSKWKLAPKGALLQICILQMALAEMDSTDTSPNVIVNEAVELAKRFCDLAAPRIINGCLGSYIRRRQFHQKPAAAVPMDSHEPQLQDALQPKDLGWNEDYVD